MEKRRNLSDNSFVMMVKRINSTLGCFTTTTTTTNSCEIQCGWLRCTSTKTAAAAAAGDECLLFVSLLASAPRDGCRSDQLPLWKILMPPLWKKLKNKCAFARTSDASLGLVEKNWNGAALPLMSWYAWCGAVVVVAVSGFCQSLCLASNGSH